MMRSTLGAPLGGTTRGGHQGVESLAVSLITPPNFGGGGGICFPLMVVVASAWPNVPVTTCAWEAVPPGKKLAAANAPKVSLRNPAPKSILSLLTSGSQLAFASGDPPATGLATNGHVRVSSPPNRSSAHSSGLQVPESLSRERRPGNSRWRNRFPSDSGRLSPASFPRARPRASIGLGAADRVILSLPDNPAFCKKIARCTQLPRSE